MAIKLADTLAPMADFPAALAEHIQFSDTESLQEKYDNGDLGGGGTADVPIETIKVNGIEQTPVDKVVDITVPTVTNDLTDVLKSKYDSAVTDKHTHSNKTTIDKISESSDGKLLFDGNKIEGSVGEPGKSAYEIAVENGYVGTETEWIASLKGEKGDAGDRGDSGVTAPLSGFFTMYVDEDSNLYVLAETDMSSAFEYDSDTGNLYFVQEVSG